MHRRCWDVKMISAILVAFTIWVALPVDQCSEYECPITCQKNEELYNCPNPNACPDTCPSSKSEAEKCPRAGNFYNENCGPPTCRCTIGFVRSENGDCVPEDYCEICPENEQYNGCIQIICRSQTCAEKGKPIACPSLVQGACKGGCVCQDGFLRSDNGICIPEDLCPPECDENEVVDNCPTKPNDFCPRDEEEASARYFYIAHEPNSCPPPECTCQFNYRRSENGSCIPTKDCPPFDCSRPNEEYNPCPPLCPSDDCAEATPTGRCPLPGRIGIVVECNAKCRCIKGYWRKDGICVPYEDCQQKCFGQNEVLSSCEFDCPPQKTCKTRNIQVNCFDVIQDCKEMCVCKKGFYRNPLGTCISEEECDQCAGENEFFACDSACDNECSSIHTQNRTLCPIQNIVCNDKCYCEDGFARDTNGKCVPLANCPKKEECLGPNEEYVDCKITCPPEICFSIIAFYDCSEENEEQCQPGCACKPGFLRKGYNSSCGRSCDCPELGGSDLCTGRDP